MSNRYYQKIEFEKYIEIILGNERKISEYFDVIPTGALLTETFEPEKVNPIVM